VGRHTQVSQIARGCIAQALPYKHRRLVDEDDVCAFCNNIMR